jgi:hypothetical protein
MTAHVHDPAAHGGHASPVETAAEPRRATIARPRWLMPAVVGGMVVGALVVAGILPLSIVFYAALFGGMVLMHVGGHGGHGGHGGGGHAAHGDEPGAQGRRLEDATEELRLRSPGSQPVRATSGTGLDDRASTTITTNETTDDDQHRSHSCH